MMEMIDFSKSTELVNKFLGSEKKKTVEYNGKIYLLKFPDPIREKGKDLSYINNVISEYLGCRIYASAGIETQKVLLGTFHDKTEKIVCGCEDFVPEGKYLFEYKNFILADVEAETPNDFELGEILDSIEKNSMLTNSDEVKSRFWDMFVMDAFIGNPDRHIGNWGLLGTGRKGELTLAPVYDCGSCLFPLLGEEELRLFPESEYKNRAFNVYSCYKEHGKRIHAGQYILSRKNADCNAAVKRVVPRINLPYIYQMIEEIPVISNEKKKFFRKILSSRYELIHGLTLNRIQKAEKKVKGIQKEIKIPKL